jgi:DNA polymerase I-like protein with 3'-5' exonuclease and polymerase domains
MEAKPLDLKTLNPPMNITLVQDGKGLEKLKAGIERIMSETQPAPGLDTETLFVADFWHRTVRTLQIGDKHEQFVIDLLAFAETSERLAESQMNYGKNNGTIYTPIFSILDPVITTNKALKVGQNLSFEYEVLHWNFGRRIWHLYSTDLAERVIQAGAIGLKIYKEFSMASLMKRYFNVIINKDEQKKFDLVTPLTEEQIEYAAFDIRSPIALRAAQMQILLRDQLFTTATIENDALGQYTDMHLAGQRLNEERWKKRIEAVKAKRIEEVKTLDEAFIPYVGKKSEAINHAEIERLEKVWKEDFEEASPEEKQKAAEARAEKDPVKKQEIKSQLEVLKRQRAAKKADARSAVSALTKDRTKKKKILEKCEGEAFINYGSNDQLLAALQQFKGMSRIESVGDDTLLKYNDKPIIQVLRRYRKGKKETGTYGEQWITKWITKPRKEEGFLHPCDGRLHCVFNQLEAETGRSSSSKPNAQNLPQDDEVRACFIADPPNESIRISDCCEAETFNPVAISADGQLDLNNLCCSACRKQCTTHAEEYVIVTVDMSGAELRIIAELAQAKSWITAFAKGQDVHSVSTEILYPEKWPLLQIKSLLKPSGWTLQDCKTESVPLFNEDGSPRMKKNKKGDLEHQHCPPCAYYAVNEAGEFVRQKCDCPEHKELRQGTKSTNFLLCYGGGPDALADALGVSLEAAKELMQLHESKFPDIWGYLRRSGERAKEQKEARDMYGRRRLFRDPTEETAREWFITNEAEKLELDDEDKERNIFAFKSQQMREPTEDELWSLTHRAVTGHDIRQAMRAMMGSIARRGKNHCIQGTNASIIKRAMGCGFDKDGKGYLWHLLPAYKARVQNMVHDELVLQCPKRFGQQVQDCVGDAFRRAAAEVMTAVVMEHDGHISDRWMK